MRVGGGLLVGQIGFEVGTAGGDGSPVAFGVNEDGGAFGLHAGYFLEEVKVLSVGGQEEVAGEGLELGEGVGVVLRDAWVGGGVAGGGN